MDLNLDRNLVHLMDPVVVAARGTKVVLVLNLDPNLDRSPVLRVIRAAAATARAIREPVEILDLNLVPEVARNRYRMTATD